MLGFKHANNNSVYFPQACKLAIRESIESEIRRERELRDNPDIEIVSYGSLTASHYIQSPGNAETA